jgi:excinuclease ABC subunit C
MTLLELKKQNIPSTPGVYFFKDKKGQVLYVGKATSLRDRLRSYFASDLIKTRGPHIVDMVFTATSVVWEECTNVLEALILEANEIKKRKPYYNTKEKDDKSFNCIVITKEIFSRVLLVRQRDIVYKKNKPQTARIKNEIVTVDAVYGPFPSASLLKEGLQIVRRIFPFRDRVSVQKDKEVFYRQIGLSPDISALDASKKYKETIHQIKLFFGGKFALLRADLQKKMKTASKTLHFEVANEMKKKLFALDHIQDVSLLKRENTVLYDPTGYRVEGYDVAHLSGENMVGVMVVCVNGSLLKQEYKKFTIRSVSGANDPAALREILSRRFIHTEWQFPDLVVVDGNEVQKKVAETLLKTIGVLIPVVSVVKDEKHRPRAILGDKEIIQKYKLDILLANNDAHRFAIGFYKKTANRSFLHKTK